MAPAQSGLTSNMQAFARSVGREHCSYRDLHAWSVSDLSGFWDAVARWFELDLPGPAIAREVLDNWPSELPARWWPGASLNYAQRALTTRGPTPAVIARSQTRPAQTLSWDELAGAVAQCREGLKRLGVSAGDVIAGYLPVIPEATIAFLASASLGAVWVCCPPEFGVRAVVDRFSQVRPKVLFAVDGYRYGHKRVDRRDDVSAIEAALPCIDSVIRVGYLEPDLDDWVSFLAGCEDALLTFDQMSFDSPLYVLFSSGTTGQPKAIVHGHGGILLEHVKALSLQHDLRPGDRMLWYTTTGWMMWNYLQSALLIGTTIVLVDGDPNYPEPGALWRLAAETGATFFGTSPAYLRLTREAVTSFPGEDEHSIRAVGVTGAPVDPEHVQWIADTIGVPVQPISGGTDVATAFVGPAPHTTAPAGWNAVPFLGVAIEARAPGGESVIGDLGELVITQPMPSMPVSYWNDLGNARYRDTYFCRFDGVWTHGDWIEIAADGASRITGRSDATLNRGGTRLGTSEFYSVVEKHPEIVDALVVHLEQDDALLLFVALKSDNAALDRELEERIRTALRSELSPRHVPDEILQVRAVPRTLSGKKLEVPVKRILLGADPATVASADALLDPGALDDFVVFADKFSIREA